MLIAIDIDEVLADFVKALIDYHNQRDNKNLTREQIYSYQFSKVWGITAEEADEKIRNFFTTHHFKNIQPVEGAIEAVDILKRDHKLIIITSRSLSMVNETKKWLNKYFPNKFSKIHHTQNGNNKKKSDICTNLKVNVLIEDSLEYAMDCAHNRIKVLLFDCPWNQSAKLPNKVTRVKSWQEIVNIISTNNLK